MAGDWIKMRIELQTHPKVVRILSATKADKFRVIGGLHAVWSVFDAHCEDGILHGYTPETLDHIIGWDGFSSAMILVGWLEYDGNETLLCPNFTENNGQSAKRRAEDQKRKREYRNSPQNVRKMSANNADSKRTREEKRREDINTLSCEPDPFPQKTQKLNGADAKLVLEYLNSVTGSKFQPVETNLKIIQSRFNDGATVAEMSSVIDAKNAEWKNDDKMREYLRPATLFNATKYAQYVGQLSIAGKNKPYDQQEFMRKVGAI